jgi:hypothetical protein
MSAKASMHASFNFTLVRLEKSIMQTTFFKVQSIDTETGKFKAPKYCTSLKIRLDLFYAAEWWCSFVVSQQR